jgi:hypothetical protein
MYQMGLGNIFTISHPGSIAQIFVPSFSQVEIIPLPEVLNWSTDKQDCTMVLTDLVTDATGATNVTGGRI